MQNLTAQITSDVLQFPETTVKALQEDEIQLDSVVRARFTSGRAGLGWLACGPQLEVTNCLTGERLSAYHFSGVTERPPAVVAVKEFSWQKKTGLLVGLVEIEGSVLCLYDISISRVVKAVVLPGLVTAVESIINHGGASASTQHLHQSLRWFFGVAAVVTDVGHVLLIDLCLDDVSSSQDELDASDLEVISGIPSEIPKLREAAAKERRHLCLQLLAPSGTAVSTLCYISRTNQLAVGFSDGYLSLWNMKTLRREYHIQIEGGKIPVSAVAFQEPENDPRNCCYLWAVQATPSDGEVSLHLLQLAFGDRKCLASGQIVYENLEYCEERYSLDLSNSLSLRSQSNSTKLLSCQTIEKFHSHSEREDSLHEVTSPDTSVTVFSWQVTTYGHGKPSVYMAVFDINRWYQAQMPDSLRPGQFLRNCSYFAFWSLESVVNMTQDDILDILVHERSFSRGAPTSYPPPEQFYYPSTYSFDATCLLISGVIHIACTGFQKETLYYLKNFGGSLNETVPDGYSRCLVAGLLSPRLTDVQPSNLSQEEQLQAVLSAAVETSSLSLLTRCIKQWTAEEQPRSAANLRFVLEWTWDKVVNTKKEFDRLCIPLFNGSCNFIDPQTLQSLQHCQLRLANLTTVSNCFLTEAQELTKQGFTDLTNKQSVTKLLAQYTSVVLWFCRCGLLPDYLDETMQLNRPYYNYQLMQQYYTERRKKLDNLSRGKWKTGSLMIDGMVGQLGEKIELLWKRDEGGTGKYPPANLHALLDLYLLENTDEINKHAVTIYFLLDIMYSFPDKPDTSIESFPTAFSVPCGLTKLIQGFWLLDHNDCQNSVNCILHPAASRVMAWQHSQIIETLMCQGDHRQALRYIQLMKPPAFTSAEVKQHITVMLSNKNLTEAWNLQRQHSTRLNEEDLLKHMYEICQEMGIIEELLKLTFTDSEHGYLQRFLQTGGAIQNQELLLVHHLQRANYIKALQLNQSLKGFHVSDLDRRLRERAVARNSIIDQYGKILPRVQRTLANERIKPYALSSTIWKEVTKPKPLSTVAKQAPPGSVITKANFISNVLMKIKEVSSADVLRELSPQKSLTTEEHNPVTSSPLLDAPNAFGTPISKPRRMSRFLDSLAHPIFAEPSLVDADFELTSESAPHKSSIFISSPDKTNLQKIAQLRNLARATEFNILETPVVVKRAKALPASATSSLYSAHTPLSILRSSARSTPLASPSISPGRSITPPLRIGEAKISFMEQINNNFIKTNLTVFEQMPGASFVLKTSQETKLQEKMALSSNTSVKDLGELDGDPSDVEDGTPSKMEASREASNVSARSDQTTLEYHDAASPEDLEDDLMMLQSNSQLCTDDNPLPPEADTLLAEVLQPENVFQEFQDKAVFRDEDIVNTYSEHLKEEVEADEVESQCQDNSLKVEKSPCAPVCHSVVNQVIKEKDVSEFEPVMDCHQLCPVTESWLNINVEDTEQHLESELSSERISAENELDDGESENAIAPSNFTLMLQDDAGEDEVLNTEALQADCKDLGLKAPSNECLTLSEESVNQEVKMIDSCPANAFCLIDAKEKRGFMETFPNVPKPIKAAVQENMVSVFDDFKSKNFATGVNSESVQELKAENEGNAHLTSRKSIQKVKKTSKNDRLIPAIAAPKTSDVQMVKDQETSASDKSAVMNPQTPRRSVRKSTKFTENTTDCPEVENDPTPRRGGRKKAKENIENLTPLTTQEEQPSSHIVRRTRSSVPDDKVLNSEVELTNLEEIATQLTFSPARSRRNKAPILDSVPEENQDILNVNSAIPCTPSRVTRSSKIMQAVEAEPPLLDKYSETFDNEQVTTPTRGQRSKRVVNELVKHFELNVSPLSSKMESSPPMSPKRVSLRWTRVKLEDQISNKAASEENLPSQEQTVDTPRKRARRSTVSKTVEKSTNLAETTLPESTNDAVLVKATKKRNLSVRKTRKSTLASVSEENVEERLQDLKTASSQDTALNASIEEQNKSKRITRTRSSNASFIPGPTMVTFAFTTPTSRRKKNAKGVSSISPEAVQSAVTSQYVFSPPSLRTRKTNRTIASVTENKQNSNIPKPTEVQIPEESLVKKPRGRPPKHKAKEMVKPTEKSAWSPPPVEIQLLSPPESPAVESENIKSLSTKKKSLRHTRRRMVSKPVTRRKIR